MVDLRDYQKAAVQEIRDAYGAGNRRVVLELPTGSGKTYLSMFILKSAIAKGKRVAFVVDRLELLEQASRSADDFGIEHGVIQSGHWRWRPEESLQICTIQTLKNKYKDFDFVVVDECHTIYKHQNEWMDRHNAVPFLGLSATPWTKGMAKNWECLLKPISMQELIDQGNLVPFRVFAPDEPDLKGIDKIGGDYNQRQLGERVNNEGLVGKIVKTWLKRGESRQTIVFCVDIAHCNRVADEFRAVGIESESIHSKLLPEDRQAVLEGFAKSDIRVVTSVDVLTKGYDNPAASCLVLARPTRSRAIHVQQVGRVLRTAEGKEDAIILDHAGNHLRLGFATDETPDELDGGKKGESENKEKEKEEKLPKKCPSCENVKKPGQHTCPYCGFTPEQQSDIEEREGELKELKRVAIEDKQQFYRELLYVARQKGYADGWASHKYKEKFKVWPSKKSGLSPVKPSQETLRFLKHLQIKWVKSQKKSAPAKSAPAKSASGFHPEPLQGYDYSLQHNKSGGLMVRVEKNGVFQGWATQTPAILSHVGG